MRLRHTNKRTHTHAHTRMHADILRNVTCQPAAKYNGLRACRCLCVWECVYPYLACYEKCIQRRLDEACGVSTASPLSARHVATAAAAGGVAKGEGVTSLTFSPSLFHSNGKSCPDKWLGWLSLRNQSLLPGPFRDYESFFALTTQIIELNVGKKYKTHNYTGMQLHNIYVVVYNMCL